MRLFNFSSCSCSNDKIKRYKSTAKGTAKIFVKSAIDGTLPLTPVLQQLEDIGYNRGSDDHGNNDF